MSINYYLLGELVLVTLMRSHVLFQDELELIKSQVPESIRLRISLTGDGVLVQKFCINKLEAWNTVTMEASICLDDQQLGSMFYSFMGQYRPCCITVTIRYDIIELMVVSMNETRVHALHIDTLLDRLPENTTTVAAECVLSTVTDEESCVKCTWEPITN